MMESSAAKICESLMLVAFGFAWPANILNTYRRKSARGKSLSFLLIIETGYLFGVLAKIASGAINYVFFFYILNMTLVSADVFLYFWYRREERAAGRPDA
ncbi:MAG: hypothetical protein LBR53_09610 [Deltaproteobacteria bacterium]|jgi:hypothetical protein|nr:hypothetical protein [Deltaproteobacteria bacterium]